MWWRVMRTERKTVLLFVCLSHIITDAISDELQLLLYDQYLHEIRLSSHCCQLQLLSVTLQINQNSNIRALDGGVRAAINVRGSVNMPITLSEGVWIISVTTLTSINSSVVHLLTDLVWCPLQIKQYTIDQGSLAMTIDRQCWHIVNSRSVSVCTPPSSVNACELTLGNCVTAACWQVTAQEIYTIATSLLT